MAFVEETLLKKKEIFFDMFEIVPEVKPVANFASIWPVLGNSLSEFVVVLGCCN